MKNMKNKLSILLLTFLLTGCNSYNGPYFYVPKDDNPRYILWETVTDMARDVDQISNLIFVIGTSTCSYCEDLEETIETYISQKDFSIYHINFDVSIESSEDYYVLLTVTNGGTDKFLPNYGELFYVPWMFVVQEKVAVYSIEEDFTKTLDNCIKTR